MKKLSACIVLLTLLGLIALPVWAQQRGKDMQQYSRNYDASTVETIQGEITEVSYKPSKKKAAMMGVQVVVKTDAESIPVHLGPVWYLEEQERLEVGDQIEVTGSRITYDGAPAIVASTIKRDKMMLRLRDQNGFPVWRGWRMSSRINN